MSRKSLAFTSRGAKVTRAKASEASKDAIGLMGIRIHELMQAVDDGGLEKDAELQCSIRELQRVLGSVDPLLSKVKRKIEKPVVGTISAEITDEGECPGRGRPATADGSDQEPSIPLKKEHISGPDKEKSEQDTTNRPPDGVMNRTSPLEESENLQVTELRTESRGAQETADKVVSMQWDAGPPHGRGHYVGTVEGGKPYGQGVMEWPSGKTFKGCWKRGRRDGQGWQRWTDGRTFEGEWQDGKPHGMGRWTSPRGESYVGQLSRGKKSGKGTFTYADGKTYSGEWLEGQRHGQGTRLYPDGSLYIGTWRDDVRNGLGMYMWKDGREWIGEWSDGNPVKKGSRDTDGIARDSSHLDIARVESDSTDLALAGEHGRRHKSGTRARTYTGHSSPDGFPPTAPEPRNGSQKATAAAVRQKSAAAAAERLRKASTLKTDTIVMAAGINEDWIERQGTASTLAGTMTDSEWAALSEEPNANTNASSNSKNGAGVESSGFVEDMGRQRDTLPEGPSAPSTADSSSDSRKNGSSGSGGKARGLFGGAAERIGQWGTARVLGSVGRRRGERSVSREREKKTQPDVRTPEKSWGFNARDGGSARRNRQSKSLGRDRARTEGASFSPSTMSNGTRSRADTAEDGRHSTDEDASRQVSASSFKRLVSPSAAPSLYPRSRKDEPSSSSNLTHVPASGATYSQDPKSSRQGKNSNGVDAVVASARVKGDGRELSDSSKPEQVSRDEQEWRGAEDWSRSRRSSSRRGQSSSRRALSREGQSEYNAAGRESGESASRDRESGRPLSSGRKGSSGEVNGSGSGNAAGGGEVSSTALSRFGSGRLASLRREGGSSSLRLGKEREPSSRSVTSATSPPLQRSTRDATKEKDSESSLASRRKEDEGSPRRPSSGRRGDGHRDSDGTLRPRSRSRRRRSQGTNDVRTDRMDESGRPPLDQKTPQRSSRRVRERNARDGESVCSTTNAKSEERHRSGREARIRPSSRREGGSDAGEATLVRGSHVPQDGAGGADRDRRRGHATTKSKGSAGAGESSGWEGAESSSRKHRERTMQGELERRALDKDSSGSGAQEREMASVEHDVGEPHGVGDYIGETRNDLPHGQGRITWKNGKSFTGTWKQGRWTGYGTFFWPDGRRQEGEWKDNTAHGKGTFVYQDGSTYVGNFRSGLKHGHGVRMYTGGETYDGEWQYGVRHGQGVWSAQDGNKFEGEYANDRKNGQGTYTWADGRRHVGTWQDGKQHGQGILYAADGRISLQGKWKRGEKTLFF